MKKTNWLIITCITASITLWLLGENPIIDYFAFSTENLINGRIWTLLTGLFLHSNITHLLGNMAFLYIFGNTIEDELGTTWILIPFLTGGTASFILSALFYQPTVHMIGASAAIFTLTAIVMLLKPLRFSLIFLMPLGLVAITYFMFNLIALYTGPQGNISYIGHIIGFLIGVPFGIASTKGWPKNLLITTGLLILYITILYLLLPTIITLL
jgi:membrane associated rhomboid family serine protease